ncbi:MAG: SOS response-associated peptidase [Chloroflexi bacterium]|nr:SOS response-associated peptidase [Chloroflexota bacterium]
MCGRFTLTVDAGGLQQAFPWVTISDDVSPRYNVAPTQSVAVVANSEQRALEFFRWGLIPSWAKDPAIGNRMINARGETVAEKPSFRVAFKLRRFLIFADGFYEWRKNDDGSKTPVFIHLKDRSPFAFAGLWEVWRPKDAAEDEMPILSCTIITTEPNELLTPIHNRMPVILPQSAIDTWLDPAERSAETFQPLLAAYPGEEMDWYPVSTVVNNPRNDIPEAIVPA